MAELKRVWIIRDYNLKPEDLFTDPAHKDDEDRLRDLGWDEDGVSVDSLVNIIIGGFTINPRGWQQEKTKLYTDAASARKDAEKRLAKLRAKYEARKGKTAAERIADRFQDQAE